MELRRKNRDRNFLCLEVSETIFLALLFALYVFSHVLVTLHGQPLSQPPLGETFDR